MSFAPHAGSCRRTSSRGAFRRRISCPSSAVSVVSDLRRPLKPTLRRDWPAPCRPGRTRPPLRRDRKLSRSVSRSMRSIGWPVCSASISFSRCLQVEDFLGVDLDVRGLALEAAHRLVDHHARIRQAEALALGAGRQQEGAHAGRLADAQRRHIRLDELHGVVDRHARPSPSRPAS